MICRIVFFFENQEIFNLVGFQELPTIAKGGVRFDWAAICYTNMLYMALLFLPLHYKEKPAFQKFLKTFFIIINAFAIIANLADAVYFKFIGRRTTASVFTEFKNDNIAGIVGVEIIDQWYLTLIGIGLIYALYYFYKTPRLVAFRSLKKYYTVSIIQLMIFSVIFICGVRGWYVFSQRPINNREAKEYVKRPLESAIVLNTPFSICRTIGKKPYVNPGYYTSEEELNKIFTPVHHFAITKKNDTTNVVVLILESFGNEYSARLNPYLQGEGYMPFLDSLMNEGLTFEHTFANGRKSVDAQASILTSIPMFIETFITSHAAMNKLSGLASKLKRDGYTTAYFHGAENGSLGIEAFVKSCGFEEYYGRSEYNNDDDFDNYWGIWDEEFLLYSGQNLSKIKEPFIASIFTLSSHHPFQIPERYKDRFPEEKLPIHKTIRYTDMALKKFFEYASQQSWFNHTLFVLTGDHTNQVDNEYYLTDKGRFEVPIFFYHPTDERIKGNKAGIAQQIDIMPTVLNYLGYSEPYFAFGVDLLSTSPGKNFAVNYVNDVYQYFKGNLLLQFDGKQSIALYDFKHDPMLKKNLLHKRYPIKQREMEKELKAIIQQYMERMNSNRLTAESEKEYTPRL